ncbi:MAG: hypothetical protein K6C08_09325 [Oscillospiraceae bacterium]|nr:hypothetical protein [Oscillospiraceae bacterium]
MSSRSVIEELAETYPQLYLNPDTEEKEAYRKIVLEGETPEKTSLSHFSLNPQDTVECVETPAGKVQVVSIRERRDYELFVRCMMAAREGPLVSVPRSQGASTLVAFNWPRIHAHHAAFMAQQLAAGAEEPDWAAEFKRFTSVRENYQDMLVVLSWGPYSNIAAAEAGQDEETWPETSYAIRKYHELTHVICRRQYPDRIDAVWDELVADAVGIYAALGHFDAVLEKRCLGIVGSRYVGGRLENYSDEADKLAVRTSRMLDRFANIISSSPGAAPFDLIPVLQSYQTAFHQV